MLWDIFCRVIDNYGDIGVCWRLCADLATRGQAVRLWVDDGSALQWMAPGALNGEWPGVQVLPWNQGTQAHALAQLPPADVWIEAFGCDIPDAYVSHFAERHAQVGALQPVWINLEYLSAEPYVERSHRLPSPVMQGPGKGRTKYFFYPGFTENTGGLLREPWANEPLTTDARVQFLCRFAPAVYTSTCASTTAPTPTLAPTSAPTSAPASAPRLVSLFCYEPPLLAQLLAQFSLASDPTHLLVTHGRATRAAQEILGTAVQHGQLQVTYLPPLTQRDFDTLLRCCSLNFVRGEDSVIRAIWAGNPFVWHIYPQDDGADAPKLEAFLAQMQLSAPVRQFHRAWNGVFRDPQAPSPLNLAPEALVAWRSEVQAARTRLLKMADLTTQLHQFVLKNR